METRNLYYAGDRAAITSALRNTVSFSSDFMKQYTQEGAIGMTDTKKYRGQGMQ